jgi:glycosyltransferase involved in cell wall biosynthesis
VLTTRFNGASEFFDHGRSAWILDDSADDRAAADAIISWLDPHVRLDMAEAGRVAAGTATHDRCFARLLATCHRIIERRRAA